jgi:thymidine kinase
MNKVKLIQIMVKTRIEIILGCMFSGKSTELLRRCNRYKAIGKQILLINHKNDTRTENKIKTHNNVTQEAIKINKMSELFTIHSDLLEKADVIGIDEAQFFDDLHSFVEKAESYNKIIIISGLDGDSNRKPFGEILMCIPLCDEVVKLTAMDMLSHDGTPAIFTKRISDDTQQVCVGSTDKYLAVSRQNYLI